MQGHIMAVAAAFPAFRRSIIAVALVGLSACQTATIEDIVPQARKTGTFPNLNIAPTPETTQLTDAEKNAKVAELRAAQQAVRSNGSGGTALTSQASLRQIGQTHASETLQEIEGE